jgi:hypothetical protein
MGSVRLRVTVKYACVILRIMHTLQGANWTCRLEECLANVANNQRRDAAR